KADLLRDDVLARTVLSEFPGFEQLEQPGLRGQHFISGNRDSRDHRLGVDRGHAARKEPGHLVTRPAWAGLDYHIAGIADDVERALTFLDDKGAAALISQRLHLPGRHAVGTDGVFCDDHV